MIGLLVKDFYLTRRVLALCLPVLWLYAIFSGIDSLPGMTGAILCLIWLPVSFMVEPPDTCPIYALPFPRSAQALPRYILFLGVWLAASLPALVLLAIGHNPLTGRTSEASDLLGSLILTLFAGSLALPLMFHFPGRQSIFVILCTLATVLVLALVPALILSQNHQEKAPTWLIKGPELLSWVFIGLIAMLIGSFFLSRRILDGSLEREHRQSGQSPKTERQSNRAEAESSHRQARATGSMVAALLRIQFGHGRGIWISAVIWVALMAGSGILTGGVASSGGKSISMFTHFSAWFSGAMAIMLVDLIAMDWRGYNNQDPHSVLLSLPISRGEFIAWKLAGPWCLLLAGMLLVLAIEGIAWGVLMIIKGSIPPSIVFSGLQGIIYPLLAWSLIAAAYLLSNAASGFRLRSLVLIPIFLLYYLLDTPIGGFRLGAWLQDQSVWCSEHPWGAAVVIIVLNGMALAMSIRLFRTRPLASRALLNRQIG